MMNDIFPTSYGRTDGKVTALKALDGWILRSLRGPAWFWNHVTKEWDISCVSGFRADSPCYVMSQKEALRLLPEIEPVK